MELRRWVPRHLGLIGLHAPWRIDFSAAYFFGYKKPGEMARGGIIAVAEIADVLALDELTYQTFLEQHRQPLPMIQGTYGIILKNIRPLSNLVPCRGHQGVFALPAGVEERIRNDSDFPH